jgi:anti-anti-sigma factor
MARARDRFPKTPLARVCRAGRTGVVSVQGALQGAGVGLLAEALEAAGRSSRALVVDLRAVPYADSDGIRTLMRLQTELSERQVRLSLIVPPASAVRRALHLLGFDRLFDLHQTPRQAWRAAPRRVLA